MRHAFTSRDRVAVVCVVAALMLTGCRDPELTPPAVPGAGESSASLETPDDAGDIPDPRDAALRTVGRDLLATLRAAQSGFDSLAGVASLEDAAPVALRLRAVLAADPRWSDVDGDGTPDDLGVRPLLPGPLTSREETLDYGDAFTAVLGAARDSGTAGAAWVDVLRDPIVSDLGAWQRDTGGMLAAIEDAARRARSVSDAEATVQSLAGEAPRALAWALLAVNARDLATLQAYGERGAVHVELMLEAVAPLLDAPAPEGPSS